MGNITLGKFRAYPLLIFRQLNAAFHRGLVSTQYNFTSIGSVTVEDGDENDDFAPDQCEDNDSDADEYDAAGSASDDAGPSKGTVPGPVSNVGLLIVVHDQERSSAKRKELFRSIQIRDRTDPAKAVKQMILDMKD
ncbi:hypothetical protein B0H13DRAFT_1899248 [Mycena leptocephala]|nr:hypothetical protein B0H13DRAFT_1899248 [Mycena leptocephala]